jgi:hypothetical protein
MDPAHGPSVFIYAIFRGAAFFKVSDLTGFSEQSDFCVPAEMQ